VRHFAVRCFFPVEPADGVVDVGLPAFYSGSALSAFFVTQSFNFCSSFSVTLKKLSPSSNIIMSLRSSFEFAIVWRFAIQTSISAV